MKTDKESYIQRAQRMSSSLSFHFPKALPPLSTTTQRRSVSLSLLSQQKQSHNSKKIASFSLKATDCLSTLNKKSSLGIQVATILTTVAPVTGVNNEEDFTWVLIQLGISAIFYFLVVPTNLQCVSRLLLWAPFLNFRKFPQDPSMKYPWETPEDPSKIKNAYLKYPWATPEDYD